MINKWIAEATECDFKAALETKKPKSWLKTVSAFANGEGGVLIFGVDDDHNLIGLVDPQSDAETISQLINERISPVPRFILTPDRENHKAFLVLSVFPGQNTPYYYKGDGKRDAYVRIGNESVPAPEHFLRELLLKGVNLSWDALVSSYNFSDYSFSKLRERYKIWTGNSFEEKYYDAFGIRSTDGRLTNAGALIADESPIRHSRLFCTRWAGLTKSGGLVDAWDHAEYSGSLILLLNEGVGFIRRNMRTIWKKLSASRLELPDYVERSFFEGLVNALIHRDYLILGSEVHIDIYDDRMTIYSPGGMPDGTFVQFRDLTDIPSTRRNPVLADIFGRLGYMERQGTGLSRIREAYEKAANFSVDKEPAFLSDQVQFQLTLPNLNYGVYLDPEQYDFSELEETDPKQTVANPEENNLPHSQEDLRNKLRNNFGITSDQLRNNFDKLFNESQLNILYLLINDPYLSAEKMAEKIGISRRSVENNIMQLKHRGYLIRRGSRKNGYWEVVINQFLHEEI